MKDKFFEIFGKSNNEIRVFQSPGRVNLIGEHIDYNGGYVFPAALSMCSTVYARKRQDSKIRMLALDLGYVVEADYKDLQSYKNIKWGNYQLGVADELIKAGYEIQGCEMIFDDRVPFGSGLSSSAAIEVVTAFALLKLSGYDEPDLTEVARIAQKAEHNFIGVKCGIMDQFASAMGKKDNAILLDCKTLDYRHIPLDLEGHKIIIINTNKKRSLGESKYNERRHECEMALLELKKKYPQIEYLCDLTYKEYMEGEHLIKNEVYKKRAEHAVSENMRVLKSVEALLSKDLTAFGKYMNQSHCSLRDLYEVSCLELDTLFDLSMQSIGVLGSRMTGAGFGGCTVSIVKNEYIDSFIEFTKEKYRGKIGYDATFYISEVGEGAREVYL